MQSLPFVLVAAALLAGCAPEPKPTCETRPDGVHLYVGRDSDAYGDIVGALRSNPDGMVALAPSASGNIGRTSGPLICETGRAFPKSVHISYPPRNTQQVGAGLDLYFGQDGRVDVAEFYVIPLAP